MGGIQGSDLAVDPFEFNNQKDKKMVLVDYVLIGFTARTVVVFFFCCAMSIVKGEK